MSNTQTPAKLKVFRIGLECKDIWDIGDIFLYDLCHTYKSCKVKYSRHRSLICKLQLIVFCHLRPSSLWDKGPSCHSASQQLLRTLLSVCVRSSCCLVPRYWQVSRRVEMGCTESNCRDEPLPHEAGGVGCCVLCLGITRSWTGACAI